MATQVLPVTILIIPIINIMIAFDNNPNHSEHQRIDRSPDHSEFNPNHNLIPGSNHNTDHGPNVNLKDDPWQALHCLQPHHKIAIDCNRLCPNCSQS